MGDKVVQINPSDGGCDAQLERRWCGHEGKTLTIHTTQMKLFNPLKNTKKAGALIAAPLLTIVSLAAIGAVNPTPAHAYRYYYNYYGGNSVCMRGNYAYRC